MMCQLGSGQDKLFYSFNLDNQVPREYLLRGIDHFLDLPDLSQHLAPFYSPMGRPSQALPSGTPRPPRRGVSARGRLLPTIILSVSAKITERPAHCRPRATSASSAVLGASPKVSRPRSDVVLVAGSLFPGCADVEVAKVRGESGRRVTGVTAHMRSLHAGRRQVRSPPCLS
jgi:hypothetical protein